MDFTLIAQIHTVAAFFGFLSICAWAFGQAPKQAFAEAEQLPFTDPEAEAEKRKALLLGR
ncbi:MAG: CcoQ/FixQ family Cbb3-type cytochrome c oxidase assembly chaperone [Azonexaceae bacterium]|uniref:cbb3-type cytochrome oxidase subunit 3 n=1 Tax=Azonexus sp. R2A61 TaxID=2744443 RepID=UPI001F22A958|nr:CcoQ/FixQ family Cbb3-type cytochrome c oxidase assembly chaperone [Azonexus sp. R2A61]MCE1240439.1 CcoQ/FixQ family Cbb3-type cytochrome c oxidase assembly chaperone [Azonexaceae bacterium]